MSNDLLLDKEKRNKLIEKLKDEMKSVQNYTKQNEKTLCRFISSGGAGFYACLLTRFKRISDYSKQALVLAGNVQQQGMNEEGLIGNTGIRIQVNPPSEQQKRNQILKGNNFLPKVEMPKFYDIFSFTMFRISTPNNEMLEKLDPLDLIYLSGVKANASIPSQTYENYTVFLNAGAVEKQRGIDLNSVYQYYANTSEGDLQSSWLKRCTLNFNEEDLKTRYDHSQNIILSVSNPLNYEKAINEHCLLETMVSFSETNWVWTDKEQKEHMKAQISYAVKQWKGEYVEKTVETIFIQVVIYEEALSSFCITDLNTWKTLAELIFKNLNYKMIGSPDVKLTKNNFYSINEQEDLKFNFALSININCLLTDVIDLYRKIGIPVTVNWVAKHYKVSSLHQKNKDDTFQPALITNLNETSSDIITNILLDRNIKYHVIITGIDISEYVYQQVRENFSPDDGDIMCNSIIIPLNNLNDFLKDKKNYIKQTCPALNNPNNTNIVYHVFALWQNSTPNYNENYQTTRIKRFINGTLNEQNHKNTAMQVIDERLSDISESENSQKNPLLLTNQKISNQSLDVAQNNTSKKPFQKTLDTIKNKESSRLLPKEKKPFYGDDSSEVDSSEEDSSEEDSSTKKRSYLQIEDTKGKKKEERKKPSSSTSSVKHSKIPKKKQKM